MQNNESYLAFSKSSKEVLRTATLFKNLNINALITGPAGSGKSLLARCMLNDAVILDAYNSNDIDYLFKKNDKIIIENFDKIKNYSGLDFSDKKVIGISTLRPDENIVDRFFGISIELAPLEQREEDILPIAEKFLDMAKDTLMCTNDISLDKHKLDISKNCHSLKKSVYIQLLEEELTEGDILSFMGSYLDKRLEGINLYREYLYLYEKPLIETGLKKYRSQLKLAEALGLNRNTLRKKIHELDIRTNNDSI